MKNSTKKNYDEDVLSFLFLELSTKLKITNRFYFETITFNTEPETLRWYF